jgi:small-conductance mechanosensitive channel
MSLSPTAKLLAAVCGLLFIHAVFHLLERTLPRHFGPVDARYRVRKSLVFAGYAVGIIFLAILFADHLGRVTLALGVAGAGVVVALKDVIASFGAWFGIVFSDLYRVGDRIQIGETRGDVVDITFLRTTLAETGSWVSGDLYNGRIVRVPNSLVLRDPVFNYSQGFRFVWDEIKIPLTVDSDLRLAKEMLLRIANETVDDRLVEAEHTWKQITEDFRLENPPLEPSVTLAVNGGSLEFTLRYIVDYTEATATKDRLFTKVVEEIANSNGRLDWASSLNSASRRSATEKVLR